MKIKQYLLSFMVFIVCAGVKGDTITNGASVTTNLIFSLNQDAGPHCFTNQYNSSELIDYTLLTIGQEGKIFDRQSPSTPEVFFRMLPKNQSFEFHLYDDQRREVSKTKIGVELSQPVHIPGSSGDVTGMMGKIAPVGAFHVFRPEDVFVMTNKGIYELELKLRIWAQTTNTSGSNYEVIGHFDKRIGTNAHFGIVTSAPARVKIIKE
jgi:hypothetical protein